MRVYVFVCLSLFFVVSLLCFVGVVVFFVLNILFELQQPERPRGDVCSRQLSCHLGTRNLCSSRPS